MLAAPFCRELHFGNMLTSRMQSHVPRCLFGSPNPKDSVELLQESLDMERSKFERRWGIDPCQEDKENVQRKFERSPRKIGARLTPDKHVFTITGDHEKAVT